MTVPRLELAGTVLVLRFTQHLTLVHGLPMQSVTFYSNSMDVLWWIRSHERSIRPFVANHIRKIQMVTEPSQWQHVPKGENPTDLCTRGATPDELLEPPKWLLSEFKAGWPKMNVRSRPASLPELKTSDRKEGKMLQMF